jgi:NitT/TauT family transport system ATP-binding protein
VAFAFSHPQNHHVLSNINLCFTEGCFVSILGPSGCGKTTLLRIMAGLLAPSAGIVRIGGQTVSVARADQRIGFLHQRPVLFPWRTVRRHVELPGEILRRPDLVRAAREFIELVGLAGFEEHYPHQLSGGMQSRLCLARALVPVPPILLLDEPFAGLDELTREALNIDLLRIWEKTRTTVVMVTHRPEEAVLLSDYICLLSGSPATVCQVFPVRLKRPRQLSQMDEPEFVESLRTARAALRTAAEAATP